MHAGWVLALLAAVAMGGCANGEPSNPNLAAPKLVLAARPDGANATVFIHSAFGERTYEWIELRVDNTTHLNRTAAFSVEETLPLGFYFEAWAEAGDAVYQLRGRVDLFVVEERASVSLVNADGRWPDDPESYGLPFEHLLERRSER